MSRTIVAVFTAALCGTACVPPPTQQPVLQGPLVRVALRQAPATWYTGPVLFVDGDSLRLYVRELHLAQTTPLSAIVGLEVFRGRRGSVGAAARGAATGTAVGVGLGAVASGLGAALGSALLGGRVDLGEAMAEGAVQGAVDGALIGAGMGAVAGDEVWQAVTVRELREELCRCRIAEP